MKGFLKCNLTLIFSLLFFNLCYAQSPAGGGPYLPVKEHGKWGYINQSAELVIKPSFDEAAYFSDGWAKVKVGPKVFFIDEHGKTVLTPNVSSSVGSFSEDLAAASKPGSDTWGYINKKGDFVIQPQFLLAF